MTKKPKKAPPLNDDTTIPVEDLAEWLCLTPRRVQQLEKKGIVHKDSHGAYQLKPSVMGYIREINAKADGKNSEYHKERTKLMKIKRQDAEREFEEAMRTLVNHQEIQRAREKKNAVIKQQLINLEKSLPPVLHLLPANEQERKIRDVVRTILVELAVTDISGPGDPKRGQDIPAAAGPDREPVGGR